MKETYLKDYYVTEDGKVFSNKTGILKPIAIQTRKDGYESVKIGGTVKAVHRLVAGTYIGNIDNLTVNHKDGIKNNNHVSNLEIMTIKQNTHHAFETGLTPIGEKHSRSKFSDEKLREALEEIENGNSVNSVSKKHSISQSYLNKVKHGIYRSISTK